MDRYVPELDGLRALAVLAVVAFHAGQGPVPGGFIGVDVFFVLSGYLITGILARQYAASGAIAIWPFYIRRLLRLMPALLLLCLGYAAAAPLVWPDYGMANHARDGVLSALYLADYGRAIWGLPEYLRHTWSLAVEEHFYLLWPLVLPAILRANSPVKVALLVYIGAALWRMVNFSAFDWNLAYYRFDSRLAGILLGCLLALWLREREIAARPVPAIRPVLPVALLALVAVTLVWRAPLAYMVGIVAVELATACLIVALVHPPEAAATRPFRAAPAVFLGRLSYGIYLWHFPLSLVTRSSLPYWQSLAVCLAGGTLLAWVSWHTVEAWGRRTKDRMPANGKAAQT